MAWRAAWIPAARASRWATDILGQGRLRAGPAWTPSRTGPTDGRLLPRFGKPCASAGPAASRHESSAGREGRSLLGSRRMTWRYRSLWKNFPKVVVCLILSGGGHGGARGDVLGRQGSQLLGLGAAAARRGRRGWSCPRGAVGLLSLDVPKVRAPDRLAGPGRRCPCIRRRASAGGVPDGRTDRVPCVRSRGGADGCLVDAERGAGAV